MRPCSQGRCLETESAPLFLAGHRLMAGGSCNGAAPEGVAGDRTSRVKCESTTGAAEGPGGACGHGHHSSLDTPKLAGTGLLQEGQGSALSLEHRQKFGMLLPWTPWSDSEPEDLVLHSFSEPRRARKHDDFEVFDDDFTKRTRSEPQASRRRLRLIGPHVQLAEEPGRKQLRPLQLLMLPEQWRRRRAVAPVPASAGMADKPKADSVTVAWGSSPEA